MASSQSGVLPPVPSHSRYLEFGVVSDVDSLTELRSLGSQTIDESVVVGLGPGLMQGLKRPIDGLRPFRGLSGPGCEVPSTQADLWAWIRGCDRGVITHRARLFTRLVQPAFRCDRVVDSFKYGRGLDLTGCGAD